MEGEKGSGLSFLHSCLSILGSVETNYLLPMRMVSDCLA